MDAIKFLAEFKRMCKTYQGCAGCRATGGCDCSSMESDAQRQELVDIVEKWSKDHPPKTRLQDFLERYPNAPMEVDGTPKTCCEVLEYCKDCNAEVDCISCWNKAMEEN